MMTAFGQVKQGQIQSDMMKDQGSFEAAQLRNMAIMETAAATRETTDLKRSYRAGLESNMAAAAASGLDLGSFSGVLEGNLADVNRNTGRISRTAKVNKGMKSIQAQLTERTARINASAALSAGLAGAVATLGQAEASYQASHHAGEGRARHFFRAFGADEEGSPFKSWYRNAKAPHTVKKGP